MKSGNVQKQPDGKTKVELKEDGKVVGTIWVNEDEGDEIVRKWSDGTYQLLQD